MTVVATHAAALPAPVRPAAPPPRPAPATAAPTAQWNLGTVAVTAPPVEDSAWIPDAVLDQVRGLVRALPGYSLASAAVGQDLLTGRPLTRGLGETLDLLLSQAGPFGAGVGRVLGALDVLGELMRSVSRAFAEHDVSFARILRDIRAAWGRFEASLLVDGNVAIVRGYVTAFVADVRAAVSDLVADALAAVRAAVGHLVEPLLAEPAVAPVWNLAVKVMGVNPLTGQTVDAPTVEILADFLIVIGQSAALEQMRERGTLQRTADWLDTQLVTFHELVGRATALFADAWNAISPANLPNLLETLPGLARRAIDLFQGVVRFGTTVIGTVLEHIKDSLLGMLSERARQVPGFRLLTVILGRDPFTGAAVQRTAEALIGGFIELLPGGQETYRKLSETGVIAAAAARIEGEMTRLNISWDLITGTFRAIWDQMSLADLLDPIGAIQRVIDRFGEPLGRIVSFVATVVEVVIELVLKLMNVPTELLAGILAGVSAALADIKRDPVAFLQNVLAALKAGFQRFFDNILVHLMAGLAGWLFRGLRGLGIEPPTELSGAAVLDLVLDVLGLSVDFLWERLAVAVGQERVDQIRGALDTLGQAWAFIGDVQERGLVAVWEYVSGQLGMLWETIVSTARDWLMTNLVQAAITKVLSMLDPTGIMAVVNSAIAFFRAVQSVIDYLTELLQIVKTYVDTLAAIARGDIAPGAAMLEQGLANAIPVAIGFLANQVGLGNVPEKIVEIIGRLRALVTRAIDWLIAQALRLGAAALRALGGGGEAAGPEPAAGEFRVHEEFQDAGQQQHEVTNSPGRYELTMASEVPHSLSTHEDQQVKDRYREYLAAVAAATSPTAKKAAADAKVGAIVSRVKAVAAGGPPRASAPGIGTVAPHRSQQSRLQRGGIRVWWLESEHVIPRGYIDALFTAAGERGTPASGSEYAAMHTVLIYERAADAKTGGETGDTSTISTFSTMARELINEVRGSPSPGAHLALVTRMIRHHFDQLVEDAIVRTNQAIEKENTDHGAERGPENQPEPATPGPGIVARSADAQLRDVLAMWRRRIAAAEASMGTD